MLELRAQASNHIKWRHWDLTVLISTTTCSNENIEEVYLDTWKEASPIVTAIHRENILASIDFLQRVMRIMIRKFGNKRKVCLLVKDFQRHLSLKTCYCIVGKSFNLQVQKNRWHQFLQTILHQEQDNWNKILTSSLHKYFPITMLWRTYNVQLCIHRILALALRKYLLERSIIMHMKWNEASYWILKMPLKITLTISDLVENKWALHMD